MLDACLQQRSKIIWSIKENEGSKGERRIRRRGKGHTKGKGKEEEERMTRKGGGGRNKLWRVFFFNLCGGILGTAATTGLLYRPRMIGDSDCGEIGGLKIGRGNRSTWRKPAPAPLLSTTKSHMTRPGFEPGPPRWGASD
jgi:hypothetical protein